MARYARVFTQFWTDEKIVALNEDERTLFLYLLTCPHGNMIGAFVLPPLYGCGDLRWHPERYDTAMRALLERHLVRRDERVQLTWLPNYLKHNPLENPSQTTAAIKVVEELPRSEMLREVAENARQCNRHYLEPLIAALEARCTPQCAPPYAAQTPTPVTVSVTVTATGSETHMPPDGGACAPQDGAKTASPTMGAPTVGKAAPAKREYTVEFERFWALYPRHTEKAKAFRVWQTRLREGVIAADLTAAAEHYTRACQAHGTEERFIKHPSTFLGPDKPYEEWLQARSEVAAAREPAGFAAIRAFMAKSEVTNSDQGADGAADNDSGRGLSARDA